MVNLFGTLREGSTEVLGWARWASGCSLPLPSTLGEPPCSREPSVTRSTSLVHTYSSPVPFGKVEGRLPGLRVRWYRYLPPFAVERISTTKSVKSCKEPGENPLYLRRGQGEGGRGPHPSRTPGTPEVQNCITVQSGVRSPGDDSTISRQRGIRPLPSPGAPSSG